MGASQITKPKMEQTNSCDSNSGRVPTGGCQSRCKETKEKSQGQKHDIIFNAQVFTVPRWVFCSRWAIP